MPTLDELLATLEEDDPDTAKALRDQIATVQGEKEAAQKELAAQKRTLKLATDKTLRERFPRALMTFDKGKLKLPDDLDEAGLAKALQEREEELAELGVPLPTGPTAAAPAADAEPVNDPAANWGEPVGGSPNTPERDVVKEFWEAMRGTTSADRVKAAQLLAAMNRMGYQAPEGKIQEIAAQLADDEYNRPIEQKIW